MKYLNKYLDDPIVGEIYVIDILSNHSGTPIDSQIIGELVKISYNSWRQGQLVFKIFMSTVKDCWRTGGDIRIVNDTSTYNAIKFNIYILNDNSKK